MQPLEPLAQSSIAHLIKSAAAPHVRKEIERLGATSLDALGRAALAYARGALALREGALDAARADLEAAAEAFAAAGEIEAERLSRCEAWIAAIRRGSRAALADAIAALSAIAAASEGRARVTALHYQGAATRASGDAAGAQRTLLAAFREAEPFLDLRAQILNSLGTLHVVLGAYGAARALLEHAAELHLQLGDAIGEAIAHGQLGAAALALGDREAARKHLQRQEWLASRVGDPIGRARSLTFLAELALDSGRAAEAAELAEMAVEAARAADPPLTAQIAYATLSLGRARRLLGESERARADLEAARDAFGTHGTPLGRALAEQELAASAGPDAWLAPAWTLASLGLPARVARLLADRRAAGHALDHEGDALAAIAEAVPHLAASEEVALVHAAPERLAAIAARRTAAHRNLARLAALAIAPRGLVIAAIASAAIGDDKRALPPERASAAALAALPGMAVWAWPASVAPEEIGRDLAAARASFGEDTRVVLVARPRARVLAPPFHGEAGASVEGIDMVPLIRATGSMDEGEIVRGVDVSWSPEAEARVAMAGFVARAQGD
jgi:tetratricopeptide (TPR) repeat protein